MVLIRIRRLTHGPPFGILDETRNGSKAGCTSLNAHLPSLRPRLHVFGHIHEAHGAELRAWVPDFTPVPRLRDEAATDGADDADNDDDDVLRLDGGDDETLLLQGTVPSSEAPEGLERTAFVNAANWPAGSKAVRDGRRTVFGGGSFRPVVVDLRDDA
jgi:hypothetical protein